MPWRNSPEDRRRSSQAYSAAYRRNREQCLRLANWRCQIRLEGICIGAASQADHIVSVAEGGGHELTNLRAACSPCHKARTAQQGSRFRRGVSRDDTEPQARTRW
jgi:5-methylcytosine-specific restriction protein A